MKRGSKRVKVIDPCIQEMYATIRTAQETLAIHVNEGLNETETINLLLGYLDNQYLVGRMRLMKNFATTKLWPDSGQVLSTSYEEETKVLEVEFRKGGVYHYQNVYIETWLDLLLTESPGSWVHKVLIKKKYKFKKIS